MNKLKILASCIFIFSAPQIFSSLSRTQTTDLPMHVQERHFYDNGACLSIFTEEHRGQTGEVLQMHEGDGRIIISYVDGRAETQEHVATVGHAATTASVETPQIDERS